MIQVGRQREKCVFGFLITITQIIIILLLLFKTSKNNLSHFSSVYKFYLYAQKNRIQGIIIINSSILNMRHLRFRQVRWLLHVSQPVCGHSSLNQFTIHVFWQQKLLFFFGYALSFLLIVIQVILQGSGKQVARKSRRSPTNLAP